MGLVVEESFFLALSATFGAEVEERAVLWTANAFLTIEKW